MVYQQYQEEEEVDRDAFLEAKKKIIQSSSHSPI